MPLSYMRTPGGAPEATNLAAGSATLNNDQAQAGPEPSSAGDGAPHPHTLERLEGALTVHNSGISHAARQMRMSRGTLYQRLKHWRQIAPE